MINEVEIQEVKESGSFTYVKQSARANTLLDNRFLLDHLRGTEWSLKSFTWLTASCLYIMKSTEEHFTIILLKSVELSSNLIQEKTYMIRKRITWYIRMKRHKWDEVNHCNLHSDSFHCAGVRFLSNYGSKDF